MDNMRREAFERWASLSLEAPSSETLPLRAKEQVLKEFLSEIETAIEDGVEAEKELEQTAEVKAARVKEDYENSQYSNEISRLLAKTGKQISRTITSIKEAVS